MDTCQRREVPGREGGLMVVTEIAKKNKLIIPKWLFHQVLGKVRYVGIEKGKEGIEISKIEGE